MRLLQLDDQGRLSLTDDLLAGHVPPYAILSHTWGPEEVTFLDMSRSDNPWEHKAGHGKIKLCADLARRDGLRHVWVDTCCIDKSDAIELQTAINSMFKWYRNAERCYVYLHDVPNRNEFHGRHNDTRWEDAFRNSRWFTRGWTLQELIAPKRVDFYSEKGDLLGDKTSLESLICDITHIPARALRGEPLPTFTIQERMAWARNRHTKYEEDMAYCLFGIFDIHMPLIYGEGGEGALKRLREEVQKATRGSLVTDFSITFSLFDVPEIQYFVARKGELEEMRGALVSDGSRRIVTLQGLGGLGKTQLAIEYAKHHRDDHSATFWINVKDETSVRQSFTRVARQILQQHPNASRLSTLDLQSDNEEAIESVKAWLSLPGNTRWLVVYDNYDNPRSAGSSDDSGIDIQRFLPTAHQGAIIITTRSALVDLGHQIRMRKLQDFNDCLEILSKTSGRVQLEKDTDVQRLIDELDGLPLALATAGAYLKRVSCTLGRYLFLYKSSWERLHTSAPRLGSYRDRTLCSTWQISYDQVLQCNPLAANLLRWWAYFDNEDIWFELFRSCREDSPAWVHELTEELNFNSAMIVLHDYGFVEPHTSGPDQIQSTGYSIHSCLHTWTIHVLNRERNEQLSRLAIHCVALGITDFNVEGGWKLVKRLLSHAMAVSTNAKVGDERLSADFLLLGDLFVRQYKLRDAQHMYRLTHQGRENAFGPDHELTIAALHALIFVHDILEEYPVAEEMCSRILIRREKALGPDHQDTLATVYSLASLYEKQGKPQAEEMYLRALQGNEKALGPDHPSTLATVFSLAWLYEKQSKPQAEEMFLRALQGNEKALGPDHRSTLATVSNLASLYDKQGKPQAEEMYLRALRGKEKALGPDHPSTLATVYSLAWLYDKQGKPQAEEMYLRALRGEEKALGPDHPSTLATVSSLAWLYEKQGKPQAEEMYLRALQGEEKALGPDHLNTLGVAYNLGLLYLSKRRFIAAEEMLLRALRGEEKALGPDHPDTLATVFSLASLYEKQGKPQAEEMYLRALRGKEKALGPDHPSTLATVYSLAWLYEKQGKPQAEEMFLRALRGEEKALGPDHPNTLGVAYNLGLLYLSKRRFTAAEEMLLRALRGYDKTMGAEEISTYRPAINATLNMGILLWEQGKPLEALPYYQRAHCNLEGLLGSTHEDVQKLREEMAKLQEEMVELSKAERKKQ